MKLINVLLLILTINFHSCTTLELKQMEVFIAFKDDGSIDSEGSACWKRDYHYGMDFLGPLEKWIEVPMIECRHIYGHKQNDYKLLAKEANTFRINYRSCRGEGD